MSPWIAAPLALLIVIGGVVALFTVSAVLVWLTVKAAERSERGNSRIDVIGKTLVILGCLFLFGLAWYTAFFKLMGWPL